MTALASVLAQVETFRTPEIEWYAIVPLLILVGGALVMMVKAALLPNLMRPGIYALGTVIISGAALIDACFLWNDVQDNGPKSVIAGALELDGFSVFFIILTCIALDPRRAVRRRSPAS